jgi:pyruvate dehydrogenase E2 component (dihydrolipoamide acetyltransferase)
MTDTLAGAGRDPQFVDVVGRRLRHRLLGDGEEVVVMVHGFGGSLETWSENQAALAAGGRTVAAIDLPGHGESSVDVGSGSLDELASVVSGYMDVMGIRRAHLVGHSMGAALCLALADRDPSRVRSLTLVGPAGIGQKINADFVRGLIMARSREEVEALIRLLYADPAGVPDELVQQVVASKQRPGVFEALTKIASSRYAGTPSGRQLRDVVGTVPTLMIWGVADGVIPPPAPGEFARKGVLLRVLPRSGHMVQAEAADEVNRLIGEFLGG